MHCHQCTIDALKLKFMHSHDIGKSASDIKPKPVVRYGYLGFTPQRKALLIRLYPITAMPSIAIMYTPNTVVSILYLLSIHSFSKNFLLTRFLL